MNTELLASGVKCNIQCEYCYQNPIRDAGNHSAGYDLAAMKLGLAAEGKRFTLFGGEALLMPMEDLEDILKFGKEKWGGSGLQTNGTLITMEHLDLFRRYNVSVGISIDGPGELNDARWAGSLEKTRAATAATLRAIEWLLAIGMPVNLIVTLHRGNATAERLPRLADWFIELDRSGAQSARLHILEVDDETGRRWQLSSEENVAALIAMKTLEQKSLKTLRFDMFSEMATLLMKGSASTCIWGGCDPLTTPAVHGVNGMGGRTNCSRTNKDGIDWVKADAHGVERYRMLHVTPQEDGGCKDCRFFFACKGQCPGTAIGGDWRNRTEHCAVWFGLLQEIETELRSAGKTPISWDPKLRAKAEKEMFDNLGDTEHQDHWDAPDGYEHTDNGFWIHGDQGETKTHGDHDDQAAGF